MNESITVDLFTALNIVVMEQLDDGSFKIIGTVPEWFMHFHPAVAGQDKLMPGKKFPFLENFLIDAESFWSGNDAGPLKSGVWIEIDRAGNECYLEASAVRLPSKNILLLSLGEIASYEEKQFLIQRGRENNLSYYRLVKEIQKKEVLIHCIVHDLAGQITAINYCFQLLALQGMSPKAREYLEIGRKQCTNQEMLIREILDAFSAEVESLTAFTLDPAQAPEALICASEVVNALLPSFSLNQVNLRLAPDIDISRDWKVVGEKLHLERVISNLVENALRHSPPNSTVTVGVQEDGEFILLTVDDQGPGVPQDISKSLFEKFSQGKDKAGRLGLGLYFCRIMVELWNGTIGYLPRAEGGSRFWVRLPKPVIN